MMLVVPVDAVGTTNCVVDLLTMRKPKHESMEQRKDWNLVRDLANRYVNLTKNISCDISKQSALALSGKDFI
jgi:hypothetical protein